MRRLAPERANEPGTGLASVGVGTCPRARFKAKAKRLRRENRAQMVDVAG